MSDEEEETRALTPLEGVERIRRVMHEGLEYWSVIDVVGFLTDAANPSKYWHTMRSRMQGEGARNPQMDDIARPMR